MRKFLIALLPPLLFCGLVTLAYRPLNTYWNRLAAAGGGADFSNLRAWWQSQVPLTDFLVYSLPGGLWVFVLSLLGWRLRVGGVHLHYLGLAFGLGFEFTQILGWTDGVFDWLDLLAVGLGFGGAILCERYWLPAGFRRNPGVWRYVLYWLVFAAAFGADVLS